VDARVEAESYRIVDTIEENRVKLLKEIEVIFQRRLGEFISALEKSDKITSMENYFEHFMQLRRDENFNDKQKSDRAIKALSLLIAEVNIGDENSSEEVNDEHKEQNDRDEDLVLDEKSEGSSYESEQLSWQQQEALELLEGLRIRGVRIKLLRDVIESNGSFAGEPLEMQWSFCTMLCHLTKTNYDARSTIGEIGWVYELIKIMRQNPLDHGLQALTCKALAYLLQNQNYNRDIVIDSDGIKATLGALQATLDASPSNSVDPDIIQHGCKVLCMSLFNEEGRKAIAEAGGVTVILRSIASARDFSTDVLTEALAALNNLTFDDLIMQEIESEKGLRTILDTVRHRKVGEKRDVQLFTQLCRTFRFFAIYGNEHHCMIVEEGLNIVIGALAAYGKHAKLQKHGAAALKNLAWNDCDHRYHIAREGAIELLLAAVDTFGQYNVVARQRTAKADPDVLEQALGALAALLRVEDDLESLKEAVRRQAIAKILGLLEWQHRALGVQLSGLKALVHLTISVNDDSLSQLNQNEGVGRVLQVMTNRYNVEDVQAYSCAYLSNLVHLGLHEDFIRQNGVEVILEAISLHAKEVHAAGFFAVCNFLERSGEDEVIGKIMGKVDILIEAMRQSRDDDDVRDQGERILVKVSSAKRESIETIKLVIEERKKKDPKNVSLQRWADDLIKFLKGKSTRETDPVSPKVWVITARDGVILKKRRLR